MEKDLKILVIGSGAREHCLTGKLSQSPLVSRIYAAPGNAGTAELAENVDIRADDIDGLAEFAFSQKIDLTVVGPEVPLAEGIVDEFAKKGLKVFGPKKKLAKLESSKVFAKEIMKKFGIATADFRVFDSPQAAKKHVEERKSPMVIKADGLAAGKGVVVCENKKEALKAVDSIMVDKVFGPAGNRIIIEDCLRGQELSLLVFSDGETIIPLVGSQDHKPIFDGDRGPNTGGMGAYAPVPLLDKKLFAAALKNIFRPLIDGLAQEGDIYKGMLYAGLMLAGGRIYVLEFNVRFGDPETQAVLPKLKSDLAEIMLKAAAGRLKETRAVWDPRFCVCLVLASGGYPGSYQKGKEIKGIKEAEKQKSVLVYHAGTKKENGRVLTNGGRVLSVVGLGPTISSARNKAYKAAEKIYFEGMQYRKDIGAKALKMAGRGENE